MTAVLFDTSAILAHYFDEQGGEEAARFMEDDDILVSVVSRVELHGRLREVGLPDEEVEGVIEGYMAVVRDVVEIDDAVARRACEIRATPADGIPLIDALIAACASVRGVPLVHRDPHFTGVPENLLQQKLLTGRP